MPCIHRLILVKLIDRGLVSEGNVMEQLREILEAEATPSKAIDSFLSVVTEKEVMEEIKKKGYDA